MGKRTSKVLGTALGGILLAFLITGCQGSGGTDSQTQTPTGILVGETALPPSVATVVNPNPGSFQPVGSIQGVVRDAVSGFAIVGARVSLSIPGVSGDTTVTTGASGQYSFTNVPASLWGDGSGGAADGVVQFPELSAYTLTVDLAGVNASLLEANPANALYPGQAFAEAVVGFASFQDGNNALLCAVGGGSTCTEGGSGASTPIDGLATSLNFVIGRLTEAVRGIVRDAQNGRPIAGATVILLDAAVTGTDLPTPAPPPGPGPLPNGIRLALGTPPVTTAADGSFTFVGVPASHTFRVVASIPSSPPPVGYIPTITAVFATLGGGTTVTVPATPAFLGDLNGNGAADCPAECAGTPGIGEIFLAPGVPGVDSTPPYVLRVSPADGADIDVSEAGDPRRPIVISFSEAMQTDNAFTRAVVATVDFKGLPIPVDAGRVSPGDAVVATTAEWNTERIGDQEPGTVLTITPINPWQPGVTYGVFLAGPSNGLPAAAPLADLAGNECCRDISLNALGTTAGGPRGTGAVLGEVLATPGTLLFTTNGNPGVLDGPAASLAANSADFNTSTATINWLAVAGARAYEVYMSVAGGDFQIIARTLPGNSPVTTLLSRSWSFNDALNAATPGTFGINPSGAPVVTPTNPTPRLSPGFEQPLVPRRILEGSIPDVGDDVSPVLGASDTLPLDGFADFSDGFGLSASQVRIAVAVVNSNGVTGSLGSPLTLRDNSGPTTNGAQDGSTPLPADGRPIETTGRGQRLLDLRDPNDLNGNGNTREADGVPDNIVIGFSEPLTIATATCADATACAAIYTLRDRNGETPARLAAISIVSAVQNEDANGNNVLDAGEDLNGNGRLDRGSNVDFNATTDPIKGNNFGNTFVWLQIAAATAGGRVDIRTGDYVEITGVQDLAGNVNRPVDPTALQNQLQDITAPTVLTVAAADITNNAPGTPDVVVINFSEPLGDFGVDSFTIRGVQCVAAVRLDPTLVPAQAGGVFSPGSSSVRLLVDASVNPVCDLSRLVGDGTFASSDSIIFAAVTTDQAGNGLDTRANALLYNTASGTFVPVGANFIARDVVRPVLMSSVITNNPVTGLPDGLTVTFNEPLFNFTLDAVQFRIRGVNCATALRVDPTAPFRPGASTVQLLVDPTVNAACDLSRLGGDGTTFGFSDQLTFSDAVTDIAGNSLNPLFNTLLFDSATTAFAITGTAVGNPNDIAGPLVLNATFVDNPAGTPDTIRVTFSEAMATVAAPQATIRGVDCSAAFAGDPNSPFRAGDPSIQYLIDPVVDARCDLSRLAGNGMTFFSSDTITFDRAGTQDVAGNLLNPDFDSLLYDTATGAFRVAGTATRIPQDRTRPQLLQVATAAIFDNPPGTPDVLVIGFNEPMIAPVQLGVFRIGGVDCLAAVGGVFPVRFDANQPFRSGDTSVRVLVDSNVNATCDLSTAQLVGDGTTFNASDTVAFVIAGTMDVALNQLNPNFDTLLYNSTTRTFDVRGSAVGIPTDLTPPRVAAIVAAAIVRRHDLRGVQNTTPPAPEQPDEIVVTFDEPIQGFQFGTTFVNIAGFACFVSEDPNNPFQAGDITVRLLLNQIPFNPQCSLARLAGNGTVADTQAGGRDDSISFFGGTIRDLAGNLINPQFDTLRYDTASGTFMPAGSELGIPVDNLRPILTSVTTTAAVAAAAPNPAIPARITLTFNERLGFVFVDNFLFTTFIIAGNPCVLGVDFLIDQVPATTAIPLGDGFLQGDSTLTLLYQGAAGAGCDPTPARLLNNDTVRLDTNRVFDTSFNPLSDLANTAIFDLPNNTWRIQP